MFFNTGFEKTVVMHENWEGWMGQCTEWKQERNEGVGTETQGDCYPWDAVRSHCLSLFALSIFFSEILGVGQRIWKPL